MANNFPVIVTEGKHSFLFIDPSASHLAWCLFEFDFTKKEMYLSSAGQIWTKDSWKKGKRFRYMQHAIKLLLDGNKELIPSIVITEGFFVNPKLMMGSAVIPVINGLIEMGADSKTVQYYEIGPSTWRAVLGIKAVKDAKGKRDYKTPTADYVKKSIKVPEEVTSNITNKSRALPHDVTDVLAIALAVGKHHGLTKVITGNVAFSPFALTQDLLKLTEEI